MEFDDILRRRKSVRTYEQRPVPAHVVDRIVSVVVHAPSAGFTQGNEFLVLQDPAAVADFFRITDDPADRLYAEMEGSLPPVVVLPLAYKRAYLDRYSEPDKAQWGLGDEAKWPVPYWDVDAGMASMLILCAAIDEGLGAWFSGIFEREAAMLAHFGVPDGYRPIGFIGLGYETPKDPATAGTSSASKRVKRSAADLLHRDRW